MKIFAAHNPDAAIRRESSSGGIFSMLAERILSEGGVVYGAAFEDDWSVAHRRVDYPDDLWRLRGSKYVYSRIGRTIQQAASDLAADRKVLFSGTPCQVVAARKCLGDNPLLLLVEVVCHGAPQSEYWDRYLDELCSSRGRTRSDITSINFRDKRTGWKNYSFTIQFNDGKIFSQPHDDNLYMRAFLQNLTLREPCFRCPFKYPDGSRADITLGDFWGISQLAPEIDNDFGTTIVIAPTSVGQAITSQLPAVTNPVFNEIARYNPAIISSPMKPLSRADFLADIMRGLSLTKVFKHYAGRSLTETIYLQIARLKHRILLR